MSSTNFVPMQPNEVFDRPCTQVGERSVIRRGLGQQRFRRPTTSGSAFHSPYGIAFDGHDMWVTNSFGSSVTRVTNF